jgi:hypothetical protein
MDERIERASIQFISLKQSELPQLYHDQEKS